MRASHREIRKRILERKSQISDEEFFTSRAYRGYMTDITESATKRYRRPISVAIVADQEDQTIAYTSPMGIWLNVSNHITESMPTRELKSISLEGLDGHEIGHNLYTDRRVWERYFTQLLRGKFYPSLPKTLDGTQQLYAEEIQKALLDELDDVPLTAIFQTAKTLENILEDGYVDARMTAAFPGRFARGIALNNVRYSETVPDLADQLFIKHQVRVHFREEYARKDSQYRVIVCRVRKRDQTRFLAALEESPKKMLLLGHTNYLDTCYALWDNLHQDEKREVFDCDAVDTIGQAQ